jgi:AcrR family transcriptional regulator
LATSSRLSAAERRASLLECACRVFSRGSYRGTTTAELAAEAGVTEPVLYRHFPSKRALYLACMEETWARVRALWDEVVAAEPDAAHWVAAMGRAFLESAEHRPVVSHLWLQALAEGTGDAEIARYMRTHIREVHVYVSDVMRRAQEAGAIPADRDPDAEAWIFLALGLLSMADRGVLGGLMDPDWEKIREARLRWLTGA